MKIWMQLMAASAAGLLGAPRAADMSAVQGLLDLEAVTNRAVMQGDLATLDSLMSEDFTFINLRGTLQTKAEVMRVFAARDFHYEFRELSDLKVRIYGAVAVVTGRSAQADQDHGADVTSTFRYTRVYAWQGGHWLAVALQLTRVAD